MSKISVKDLNIRKIGVVSARIILLLLCLLMPKKKTPRVLIREKGGGKSKEPVDAGYEVCSSLASPENITSPVEALNAHQ